MRPDICYYPKIFSIVQLPSKKNGSSWERENGDYKLYVPLQAPAGVIARLLLIHITTQAVRLKTKDITLCSKLSKLLHQLNLSRDARTIHALKEQLSILSTFYFDLTCYKTTKRIFMCDRFEQSWPMSIKLTDDFYNLIVTRPIPIDLNIVNELRNSSVAIDIYVWLTHRMSYLKDVSIVSFESLKKQFCSDYTRHRDFKRKFIKNLNDVISLYTVNLEINDKNIVLFASDTSVI